MVAGTRHVQRQRAGAAGEGDAHRRHFGVYGLSQVQRADRHQDWQAAIGLIPRAQYFPDEGPLRRALYPKHLAFFKAGASAWLAGKSASRRATSSSTPFWAIRLP